MSYKIIIRPIYSFRRQKSRTGKKKETEAEVEQTTKETQRKSTLHVQQLGRIQKAEYMLATRTPTDRAKLPSYTWCLLFHWTENGISITSSAYTDQETKLSLYTVHTVQRIFLQQMRKCNKSMFIARKKFHHTQACKCQISSLLWHHYVTCNSQILQGQLILQVRS